MNDPWNSRLDVAEALEAAGWTGAPDRPMEILRHPNGAVWAVHNDQGDCGLDIPGGGGATFPGDVPDTVVIAACLAAGQIGAEPKAHPAETAPPADFFAPDTAYRRRRWTFHCLAVVLNTLTGEPRAVGLLGRDGEPSTATSMDPDNWQHDGWEAQTDPPQCTTRLLPFTSDHVDRCVHHGVHDSHRTAAGVLWGNGSADEPPTGGAR
ncbi:hypothetical protein [Streptomyces albidoflavus]|uniref:hypothetical protein n=1 Tax=Streptomyces albidoflavus TaxID=1886 RepID=UPI0010225227|nr:hypothetical protein [Streptomyces albidoflavus]RZF02912.1 hypothetical protein C0R05_32390 [Streptomyces albidoflavus]